MKKWLVRLGGILMVAVLIAAGYVLGYDRGARTRTTAEQQALEHEFERSMTGVILEGSFTVDGREDSELTVERYTVERVERMAGDIWVFHARIQYGERDVTLPVPVRIRWAGDTPVITLTDANIPGLGTFSARVLFYRDHYAGMWSNPRVGGHQFGIVVREPARE